MSRLVIEGFEFRRVGDQWYVVVTPYQLRLLGYRRPYDILHYLLREGKAVRVSYGKYMVRSNTGIYRRILRLLWSHGIDVML